MGVLIDWAKAAPHASSPSASATAAALGAGIIFVSPSGGDDTAAINAALANVAATGGTVLLGASDYTVTDELLLTKTSTHLVGQGMGATRLMFAPTADNKTCIKVANGASMVERGSIRELTVYSDDQTRTKTAIELIDSGTFRVENVAISGAVYAGNHTWHGAGSIGIRTRGREFGTIRGIYCYADRPIVISPNPNLAGISCDHFNFYDLYLCAAGYPNVTIDSNVYLFQTKFEGSQAWVKGTHGLYWVDTQSTGVSIGLVIRNLRLEQAEGSSGEDAIHIAHNYGLYGLTVDQAYLDPNRDAFYLRKVLDTRLMNVRYPGTGVALDADATCDRIEGDSCFWQAGGSTVLAGQTLIIESPRLATTSPLSSSFKYGDAGLTKRDITTEVGWRGTKVTLADDAYVEVGTSTTVGYLDIIVSDGTGATYFLKGPLAGTVEISDPISIFVNSDTDTWWCVYWDAGSSTYRIRNRRGSSLSCAYTLRGAYAGV